MKSVSGPLATHIDGVVTSLTTCWKIKRTDGVIRTATSLDVPVKVDLGDGDGELTYASTTGYDRTALAAAADFKSTNMEVRGFLTAAGISKEDIRAELYDFADVRIFQINYEDTSQGIIRMQRGYMGPVSLQDDSFVMELRGLAQRYFDTVGDIVVSECPVDLFDGKCKTKELPPVWEFSKLYAVTLTEDANVGDYVRPFPFNDRYFRCTVGGTSGASSGVELEDGSGRLLLEDGSALALEGVTGGEPAWNLTLGGTTADGTVTWTTVRANQLPATVDVATDRRVFTVTTSPATDAPDAFLREGTVQFTTGPNSSLALRRAVKDWDLSTRKVTLWRPLPFDVTSGEELLLSSGCDKSTGVCSGTYLNIFNHRGRPHLPGENRMGEAPIVPV